MKPTGTISLYGCGGAGINVAHLFDKFKDADVLEGFAVVKPTYIDTSKSNLNSLEGGYNESNAYLFEKIDGSGSIRKENATQISKSILDILVKHEPGDLNIVVSSASGGSGSVIAPSIVSELLKRNQNVIVLCIGSNDSVIEITNTVNTLKSYESVSSLRTKPIAMIYEENKRGVRLEDINQKLYDRIVQLAALFSKQNAGLDSADLKNWLNYTKYTSIPAKLMALGFVDGFINTDETKGDPITVASLARKGFDTTPGITVDYRCYGIIPDNCPEIQIDKTLHYVIFDGIISKYFEELDKQKTDLEMKQSSRQISESLVKSNDKAEDNGLIL